jgi:hypothetical protein
MAELLKQYLGNSPHPALRATFSPTGRRISGIVPQLFLAPSGRGWIARQRGTGEGNHS